MKKTLIMIMLSMSAMLSGCNDDQDDPKTTTPETSSCGIHCAP